MNSTRKPGVAFFGVFASVFVLLLIVARIVGRWGGFAAIPLWLGTLGVWIVWVFGYGWLLRRVGKFGWSKFVAGILASVVVFATGNEVGFICARMWRNREIIHAADLGLRDDCLRLLENWPGKNSRIYADDPEFVKLPSSIKILTPLYITNERMDFADIPANLGICKCGFGGFSMGVRVFVSDGDAVRYGNAMKDEYQRIRPSVFFWDHDT